VAAKLAVRRGRPVHPAGLTPREAEILTLIAAARSNAEIADELFLSVRTVERHLTNMYNKIGVTSRVEATRFAVDQGLAESSRRLGHS
jgi:DNA-binding NarL/FixJ family response regulator